VAKTAGPPQGVVPWVQPPALPLHEQRVLLVEDSADLRLALEEVLRALGYQVESAGSGADALRVAEALRPSVAILDMTLPDTDGLRLLRDLRRAGHHETRFIALSGWSEPEAQRVALAAGFARYLVKPVEVSELEEVLAQSA
jgi:CheY-like chemotaxis protein